MLCGPVMMSAILACPLLSAPILACLCLSCHALPCPVLSYCPALACPTLPCPGVSCPGRVRSCPVLHVHAIVAAVTTSPCYANAKRRTLPHSHLAATMLQKYSVGAWLVTSTVASSLYFLSVGDNELIDGPSNNSKEHTV